MCIYIEIKCASGAGVCSGHPSFPHKPMSNCPQSLLASLQTYPLLLGSIACILDQLKKARLRLGSNFTPRCQCPDVTEVPLSLTSRVRQAFPIFELFQLVLRFAKASTSKQGVDRGSSSLTEEVSVCSSFCPCQLSGL